MSTAPKLNSPSTFCWIELACKDMPTAKEFYSSVLGWKFRDNKSEEGAVYSNIKLGTKGLVGGLYEFALPEEEGKSKKKKAPEVPAFWGSYVAVKNLKTATKKAHDLGGQIVADQVEIGDSGKMSVIQDPAGAMFGMWEANTLAGIGPERDAIGNSSWHELVTLDEDLSIGFYTKLFGWKAKTKKISAKQNYTHFLVDGKPVAGMSELGAEFDGYPPHWLVYFNVKDCDKSTKLAKENGAKVVHAPKDYSGVGRFSIVQDPEGALLALASFSAQS